MVDPNSAIVDSDPVALMVLDATNFLDSLSLRQPLSHTPSLPCALCCRTLGGGLNSVRDQMDKVIPNGSHELPAGR